jgi:hypothetical protein
MHPINLADKCRLLHRLWSPKVAGEANGYKRRGY